MKELSIEQIAKVYDANYNTYIELVDRIECVKDAIKKQNYGTAMDILCKPYSKFQVTTSSELKESRDERIRKAIISGMKSLRENGMYTEFAHIPMNDVVAWLEKQGKIVDYYEDRLDECACKYFNKGYSHALEKQGEPVEINPTEFDTRLQSLIGKFNSLPKEELIGSLSFWLNVVQNNGTYKKE